MPAYCVRRVVAGLLMLVGLTLVTFVLFFAIPGDAAQFVCGSKCSAQEVSTTARGLGYDRPVGVQWMQFIRGLGLGRDYPADSSLVKTHPELASRCPPPCLGYSTAHHEPVSNLLRSRMPVSFSIAVVALALWIPTSLVLGVVAGLRRGSVLDRGIVAVSFLLHAFPTFFVALLLLDFCTNEHHLLETPVYHPLSQGILPWLENLLLPASSLALFFLAGYTRFIRAFVIGVAGEDYLRTAEAKGVSRMALVTRHLLRAVLTPLVTLTGLDLAGLLGGTIVIERVFAFDGLGRLTVDSITKRDLPAVVGVVMVSAGAVIVLNIVVDLAYFLIDPRLRMP